MNNPYDSPTSIVEDENSEIHYAGFWIRFLACIIDSIWMMPLVIFFGFMAYGASYFESEQVYKGPADIFIQYVLPIFLTVGFWMYKSATPGKMVVKAVIVNAADLQRPSKGQLILRYVGYYVSLLVFGLGFIWAAFDPKKQAWHDKIAKTLVIYRK
ncbi:MAG: RDD family protein [Moraxellaceae bacterium]|nr:MAG: RDD family protein [Moraxellaceae bacterium]